jgi:hypothetical protein
MNSAEDENVKSSIPQAIRDFVLPAGFPGECWYRIQLYKLGEVFSDHNAENKLFCFKAL